MSNLEFFNPKEFGMTNLRRAYEEKYDAQLNEWGAKIALLSAKASKTKAKAKIEYFKTIETLQGKHAAAKTKLQELRVSREDSWEDIRTGAENAWVEVKAAFNTATSALR
jgi:hypothetical protein